MEFNVYFILPPTMILRFKFITRGSNIPELNIQVKYMRALRYVRVREKKEWERERERERERDGGRGLGKKLLSRHIIYVSPKVNINALR